MQKRRPALILAHKTGQRVLAAPVGYGIGGGHNFYFSHMLNCLYDCRYCFLQGMYRSAHMVVFINYEDFQTDISAHIAESPDVPYFFSGYDCDSLAMEGITSFSTRPLRLALVLGLLAAGAGGTVGLWEVIRALAFGISTPGYASLIAMITFLSGVQLLCVGLLGEYIGRIYMETKQRPVFIVAEDSQETMTYIQPMLRVAGHDQNQ